MQEKLQLDEELFIKSYQTAYAFDRTRAEPLYRIASHMQKTGKFKAAYPIAKLAVSTHKPLPLHILHPRIAEIAYMIGEYEQAYEACERLLSKPNLPQDITDLVKHNFSVRNFKAYA